MAGGKWKRADPRSPSCRWPPSGCACLAGLSGGSPSPGEHHCSFREPLAQRAAFLSSDATPQVKAMRVYCFCACPPSVHCQDGHTHPSPGHLQFLRRTSRRVCALGDQERLGHCRVSLTIPWGPPSPPEYKNGNNCVLGDGKKGTLSTAARNVIWFSLCGRQHEAFSVKSSLGSGLWSVNTESPKGYQIGSESQWVQRGASP